jgi:hypothetical protein
MIIGGLQCGDIAVAHGPGNLKIGASCRSPKLGRAEGIDFSTTWREESSVMLALFLGLFRIVWLFGKDHRGYPAVAVKLLTKVGLD